MNGSPTRRLWTQSKRPATIPIFLASLFFIELASAGFLPLKPQPDNVRRVWNGSSPAAFTPFVTISELTSSPPVLVAVDTDKGSLLSYLSYDLGRNFYLASYFHPNPDGLADVIVLANHLETVYCAFIDYYNNIYLFKTTNGIYWTLLKAIYTPILFHGEGHYRISPSGTHLLFTSVDNRTVAPGDYDMFLYRSTNGWSSYSFTMVNSYGLVDPASPSKGQDLRPNLAQNPSGLWVAVWMTLYASAGPGRIGNDGDIVSAFSNDDGQTWSTTTLVNSYGASDTIQDEYPAMFHDGTKFVTVWQPASNVYGSQVLMATSIDGNTWTPYTALSLNISGTPNSISYATSIFRSRNGAVITGFTSGTNGYFISESNDGLSTWTSVNNFADQSDYMPTYVPSKGLLYFFQGPLYFGYGESPCYVANVSLCDSTCGSSCVAAPTINPYDFNASPINAPISQSPSVQSNSPANLSPSLSPISSPALSPSFIPTSSGNSSPSTVSSSPIPSPVPSPSSIPNPSQSSLSPSTSPSTSPSSILVPSPSSSFSLSPLSVPSPSEASSPSSSLSPSFSPSSITPPISSPSFNPSPITIPASSFAPSSSESPQIQSPSPSFDVLPSSAPTSSLVPSVVTTSTSSPSEVPSAFCPGTPLLGASCDSGIWTAGDNTSLSSVTLVGGNYSIVSSNGNLTQARIFLTNSSITFGSPIVLRQSVISISTSTLTFQGSVVNISVGRNRVTSSAPIKVGGCLEFDGGVTVVTSDTPIGANEIPIFDLLSKCSLGDFSRVNVSIITDRGCAASPKLVTRNNSVVVVAFDFDVECFISAVASPFLLSSVLFWLSILILIPSVIDSSC